MRAPIHRSLCLGFFLSNLAFIPPAQAHWPFTPRPISLVSSPVLFAPAASAPVVLQPAPVLLAPAPAPFAAWRSHFAKQPSAFVAAPVYSTTVSIQAAPQYFLQFQPITTASQAPAAQIPATSFTLPTPAYNIYSYQLMPVRPVAQPQSQIPPAQTTPPNPSNPPAPQPTTPPAQPTSGPAASIRLAGPLRADLVTSLSKFFLDAGSAIPEAQRTDYIRNHAVLLYAGKLGISPGSLNDAERQDIEQIVSSLTGSNAALPPPLPNGNP